MGATLFEMDGTGREIAEKLQMFPDRKLHVTVYDLAEIESEKKTDSRPVAQMLAEIAASIDPIEEAKLPADFTSQLDHYIYGTPKR